MAFFGLSCVHLQGGENKNAIIMCRNKFTVKKHNICLKITLKVIISMNIKMLVDKKLYMEYRSVEWSRRCMWWFMVQIDERWYRLYSKILELFKPWILTKNNKIFNCGVISTHYNGNWILVLTALEMVIWVAETCQC
jgi:hypothetical protein